MNFLYPAFLIGAALIAIPIALHLLRRDTAPPIPFTAVRLLRKSPLDRSRRRRLRDLILLAARVTALLLLAAAFARPYFASGSASGTLRIVAVDRSFSMGAPGQFAQAVELARAAIDEASPGERVALIAFDDRADVIAAPGSASDARAALAGLKPGFGGTRYGPVLLKVNDLADGAHGRVVLVSDLQRTGWEEQTKGVLAPGFELDVREVAAVPSNVAIVGTRVDADRTVASIRNAGSEPRAGEVRVVRDGSVAASARFSAAADAVVDVPLAFRAPSNGSISVTVDDAAGFEADNTRYLLLDPAPRPAVLIVSGGDGRSGFYLARVLETATEEGDAIEPRIVTGTQLGSISASDLARYRAVVLLSTRGIDRKSRGPIGEFVRAGGGVLVAASPDIDPSVLSMMLDWQPALGAAEQPADGSLSATDLRHPIFRPFGALAANLGQVRFDRAWRLRGDGWRAIARFTDGSPALLERAEGQGRVVLFASDIDRRWNDFPLHPSFVPFAIETLRYVGGARDEPRDYVVARVPDSVPSQPGVHRLAHRVVTVNVDPREGAVARLTMDEFREMVEQRTAPSDGAKDLAGQQAESRQNYWRYALMLMLAVLVVESVVGKA